MPPYLILPLTGYTPTIGRLVAMLAYARHTTLRAVEGLTPEQLDARLAHPPSDETLT